MSPLFTVAMVIVESACARSAPGRHEQQRGGASLQGAPEDVGDGTSPHGRIVPPCSGDSFRTLSLSGRAVNVFGRRHNSSWRDAAARVSRAPRAYSEPSHRPTGSTRRGSSPVSPNSATVLSNGRGVGSALDHRRTQLFAERMKHLDGPALFVLLRTRRSQAASASARHSSDPPVRSRSPPTAIGPGIVIYGSRQP